MRSDLIDRAQLPTVHIEIPKRLDDETIRIVEGLVKAFKTVIDSAPTVDAEPVRHAFWEADVWSYAEKRVIKTVPLTEENMRKYAFRKPFDRYLTHQRCSVCGEDPLANFNEEYEFSKYCPNCGAKMDAEVKEDA